MGVTSVRLSLIVAAALVAGCQDAGLVTQLLTDRHPADLSVTVRDPGRLLQGDTTRVLVEVTDQRGRAFEELPPWALAWRSSDTAVVTVTEGLVRAVGGGSAEVTVEAAGREASAAFEVQPLELQLGLAGVHLMQAVQTVDGRVPLVAGKAGYLRVFPTGDQANFFAPSVKISLFHDGELTRTVRVPASTEGVPMTAEGGSPSSAWATAVSADEVRPGLSVRVEVDPDRTIPRAPGSVDRYPESGTALLDVREPPEFRLRFVPVHQSAFPSLSDPDITPENAHTYLDLFLHVYPIGDYDYDVRAPYVTDANRPDGGTDSQTILRELRALRVADGSARYYYGVFRVSNGGGGRGYLGLPVSVGHDLRWDGRGAAELRAETFAHELGHNFGRGHVPCGTHGDSSYPYPNGRIGWWGWDARVDEFIPASRADLMSYCEPIWISDYTHEAVRRFRWSEARSGPEYLVREGPALVLWGRIGPEGPVLDPAFVLDTAVPTDPAEGPYVAEGVDADGRILFSRAFRGDPVADGSAERHFLFTIPIEEANPERLTAIRVRAGGRVAERRTSTAGGGGMLALEQAVEAVHPRRVAADRVRIRWDADRFPLAVIRDLASGQVLSFGRSGSVEVYSTTDRVSVALSDGVRSSVRELPVRP